MRRQGDLLHPRPLLHVPRLLPGHLQVPRGALRLRQRQEPGILQRQEGPALDEEGRQWQGQQQGRQGHLEGQGQCPLLDGLERPEEAHPGHGQGADYDHDNDDGGADDLDDDADCGGEQQEEEEGTEDQRLERTQVRLLLVIL